VDGRNGKKTITQSMFNKGYIITENEKGFFHLSLIERGNHMKSILTNPILILLIRVSLGGIFVISSLDKITDPGAFTVSILNYKIVGYTLAAITATILPSLELLCGLSLILGLYPRSSALLITSMLIVFTILVISALMRGLDISCGCFSQDPGVSKIGYGKILENIGMIIMGVWLSCVHNYGITLAQFLPQKKNAPSD
jgi:putative oxidoreductase